MNKHKNTDIASAAVIVFSILLAIAYVIIMNKLVYAAGGMLYVELGAIQLTALMISLEVTAVVTVLLVRYLMPYIIRRQEALASLGENSFGKLAKDPTARLAYRGVYYVLDNKTAQAEKYLEQAINRADNSTNQLFCYEWLIRLYENDPDKYKDKLMWCYRKTAEIAPDNARLQCRLGQMYYSDGRLDNALYCFEQSIKYNPFEGFAYYMTAKIQLIRGEDERCLETLNKLLEINESHPLVYGELAIYYAMHDDIEKCDECFNKAMLCGHRDAMTLERNIDAIKRYRRGETYYGDYLPEDYYRRVEKKDRESEGKD
ncbi:MAG: tetratricopeptide repeat protein [Oscillospiraceae bacterium]